MKLLKNINVSFFHKWLFILSKILHHFCCGTLILLLTTSIIYKNPVFFLFLIALLILLSQLFINDKYSIIIIHNFRVFYFIIINYITPIVGSFVFFSYNFLEGFPFYALRNENSILIVLITFCLNIAVSSLFLIKNKVVKANPLLPKDKNERKEYLELRL